MSQERKLESCGPRCFILGSEDPAAPEAVRAYVDAIETKEFDAEYVSGIREQANEFLVACGEDVLLQQGASS